MHSIFPEEKLRCTLFVFEDHASRLKKLDLIIDGLKPLPCKLLE